MLLLFYLSQEPIPADRSSIYIGGPLGALKHPKKVLTKNLSDLGLGVTASKHLVSNQDQVFSAGHPFWEKWDTVVIRPKTNMVDSGDLFYVIYMVNDPGIGGNVYRICGI